MLTPSHAIGPQTLYPSTMDYSQYKGLQALLFFSLPVIWCVWQLIALKRSSGDADVPQREQREQHVGLTPAASAQDEVG